MHLQIPKLDKQIAAYALIAVLFLLYGIADLFGLDALAFLPVLVIGVWVIFKYTPTT